MAKTATNKKTRVTPPKHAALTVVKKEENGVDLEHYRDLLQEKADEIRQFMSTPVAAETLARREEPNDYVDLAGQSHEEWIFLNRNAQNASLLRQVEEALQRIDDGTYGVCPECSQSISQKRLEAVPWASFCITCQEKRGSWTN